VSTCRTLLYPEWIPPNLHIADRAAQILAGHNLRAPDAGPADDGLGRQRNWLITNDPVFSRTRSLDVLLLDELLS
jgi:hypothetical protein